MISVYPLFLLYSELQGDIGFPVPNATELRTNINTEWISSPNTRGTGDILYSCVFTISLCVFTAFHVNVPARGTTALRFLLRKVRWVVTSIFEPEVVVCTAFVQFWTARRFCREMKPVNDSVKNQTVPEKPPGIQVAELPESLPPDEPQSQNEDTREPNGAALSNIGQKASKPGVTPEEVVSMTYAWYVIMGGFTIDVSEIHDNYQIITLTHHAILEMARRGFFLPMSKDSIRDKSKAGFLAKGLVICQVLFVVVQCIARTAQDLPLTLLEIHTLVHVVCAAAMYIAWWGKPLDVTDPTQVQVMSWGTTKEGAGPLEICIANLLMYSTQLPAWNQYIPGDVEAGLLLDLSQRAVISDSVVSSQGAETRVFDHNIDRFPVEEWGVEQTYKPISTEPVHPATIVTLKPGQAFETVISVCEHLSWRARMDGSMLADAQVSFTRKALQRWMLGTSRKEWCPERRRLPASHDNIGGSIAKQDAISRDEVGLPYFEPTIPDFASHSYEHTLWTVLFAALTCCAYRAIHTIGWAFNFPSSSKRLLWRASCMLLMALGPSTSFLLGYVLLLNASALWTFKKVLYYKAWLSIKYKYRRSGLLRNIFGLTLPTSLFPLYVAARLFLVIEAFISLRSVPIGVYVDTSWTQYMPHI